MQDIFKSVGINTVFCDSVHALKYANNHGLLGNATILTVSPALIDEKENFPNFNIENISDVWSRDKLFRYQRTIKDFAFDIYDCCVKDDILFEYALVLSREAVNSSRLIYKAGLLKDDDIQLWVCGRGENKELVDIVKDDTRITIIGFVDESRLVELASQATAFVNPRPANFKPNELNYPSKILHYFSYCKPVLSTITPGISDEYYNILDLMPNDEGIGKSIYNILNIEKGLYYSKCQEISDFNKKHSWECQATRFISWIEN